MGSKLSTLNASTRSLKPISWSTTPLQPTGSSDFTIKIVQKDPTASCESPSPKTSLKSNGTNLVLWKANELNSLLMTSGITTKSSTKATNDVSSSEVLPTTTSLPT